MFHLLPFPSTLPPFLLFHTEYPLFKSYGERYMVTGTQYGMRRKGIVGYDPTDLHTEAEKDHRRGGGEACPNGQRFNRMKLLAQTGGYPMVRFMIHLKRDRKLLAPPTDPDAGHARAFIAS